jgi:RNA polymerase sigma factor (sigma-70 family)
VPRYPAVPILSHIRRLARAESPAPSSDADCLERFSARGEESAFETLVRRHGPMVFRVCRVTLGDAHAAEDAFQATFLTLARRAGAVRKQPSLGSWLYKVAHRIALRARGQSAARLQREAAVTRPPVADPLDEISWREVQAIFFDEIAGLSEHYRIPLLLCCLEGKTRDEAAAQLGCGTGTLKSRLERGRKLLRERLVRRGLTLSTGLLATLLAPADTVALAPAVVAVAVRAGSSVAAGKEIEGVVSERALRLSRGVRGAAWSVKLALGALLAACALTAGAALVLGRSAEALPAADDGSATTEEAPARTDARGDPLPKEAMSRLGTTRFRLSGKLAGQMPGGKTLVLFSYPTGGIYSLDLATGRHACVFPSDVTGRVYGAAVAPDGKRLATAGDRGVRIWEFTSGKLLATFGQGTYNEVHFSPDGKLLAAVPVNFSRRIVEVREADTGKELWFREFDGLPNGTVTFAPDGKTLVVAQCAAGRPQRPAGDAVGRGGARFQPPPESVLRFVDTGTGKDRLRINFGTTYTPTLKVSPDGKLVAGLCQDVTEAGKFHVRVWEAAGGNEVARFEQPEKDLAGRGYVTAMAFAPDGKTLFTSGSGGGLIEWDLATGNELRRVAPECSNANDLTFTADGKAVIAFDQPTITRLIDRASGKDLTPEPEHSTSVARVAFAPDGRSVLTGSGGTVTFWDPENGRERRHVSLPPRRILELARDGRTAVLMEVDTSKPEAKRTLLFYDLTTGATRARVPLDFAGKQFYEDSITAGQKLAALADVDRRSVHLFDLETGKLSATLQDPQAKNVAIQQRGNGLKVRRAVLGDDGRTVVALCVDHTAQVWDLATKTKLREFPLAEDEPGSKAWFYMPWQRQQMENFLYYGAVSPDCTRILYISQRGYQRLIDATTGLEVWRSALNPVGHSGLAFSPDGRTLARGEGDTICLVEVATGKERHALTGHDNLIRSFAFSPDGSLLVSGSYDTTALVWDLTGRRMHAGPVKPPTRAELDAAWASLAGDDAPKAYAAIRTLTAAPEQALPYLAERLRAAAAADPELLARLIADLDSDQAAVRDKATAELEKLGETAVAAVHKALAGKPSAEARRRLEAIQAKLSEEPRELSGDLLRTVRVLEALELIGTPPARDLVQSLSTGPRKARAKDEAKATLARLARRPAAP